LATETQNTRGDVLRQEKGRKRKGNETGSAKGRNINYLNAKEMEGGGRVGPFEERGGSSEGPVRPQQERLLESIQPISKTISSEDFTVGPLEDRRGSSEETVHPQQDVGNPCSPSKSASS